MGTPAAIAAQLHTVVKTTKRQAMGRAVHHRGDVDTFMELSARMEIAREMPGTLLEELTLIDADGQPDTFQPTDTNVQYIYRAVLSKTVV